MKLEITRAATLALDTLVYVEQDSKDDSPHEVRYDVRYGGIGDAAARKRNGILLGQVARYRDHNREWFATPDQGEERHTCWRLRWYSGFTNRPQAALFLLGIRFEQDMPAVLHTRDQHRLLRDHAVPVVDESLPESRRCEVAFRRAVPAYVNEFEILHVQQWWPGEVGAYASATVVTRRGANGDYCVHTLYWADDTPDTPWHVGQGHYDLPTFERAHQQAALLVATRH
jgi:hypothetical protein